MVKRSFVAILAMGILLSGVLACGVTSKPSILLIIADDLSYDSLGYVGGVAPEITPHIDALRTESISFEKAFATVAVCQSSRQSMLTGLLLHQYGSVGFFPIKNKVDDRQ